MREALCERCDREIQRAAPVLDPGPLGVDRVLSAGAHEGAVRGLVTSLKFARRASLAPRAAAAIAAGAGPRDWLRGSVVPVPPDPLRFRVRGFDPAEEIARSLAATAGLPLERCLERRGARRQVGRERHERLAAPPSVRAWRPPPREVLLIDDVWTTGATLGACAEALREAGCRRVSALTVAHAM